MYSKNGLIVCLGLLFLLSIISGCGIPESANNAYDDDSIIVQEFDTYRLGPYSLIRINNEISFKYGNFYGAYTVFSLESEEDAEVKFEYNSKVDSGDFKAVLITPKKEIQNLLIGNEHGAETVQLEKGIYIFKIVGRDANGEIKISIYTNQNVDIISSD